MYISKIEIENFRNFKCKDITFNEGVNVIIGHNNAGKTNLIKALSLVIDCQSSKRLEVDDFNKHTSLAELKLNPPKISIAVTINKGKFEEPDDLVTIANWLTKLDSDYEALLTYEFFLPEKERPKYDDAIAEITDDDPKALDKIWKFLKQDFIRLYTYKIWGGNISNQSVADGDSLQKFDFQFLDAIRDVERDMLTGRNTLLRDVFNFFMDYEIKSDNTKSDEEKAALIKRKRIDFSEKADDLIDVLQKRMEDGKEQILSYAKETGASFNNAEPNFEGSISDVEMFSVLKLIVEYSTGIKVKVPATHNGLGYNNLIYMSLLLAKMQVNSDGNYMGSNSKVFATLAIEEPEAHLHPAMQYKFLKFLKENKNKKKVRQIFVTTHSTHITSAVSLDEIICLHNDNGITTVGYPGLVFPNDGKSKKYVQRFLDATKSDMLFAQKVILVEGLAEQLLMSTFAQYLGKSLEDNHVAVINVGGRFFDHFLHLFDSHKPNTIHKKILCITDRDPESKPKAESKFKKCYPYEFNQDVETYDYRSNPSATKYPIGSHPNITFFSQDANKGKTLEYDLVLHNPVLDLLITDSMRSQQEIRDLMKLYSDGNSIADFEAKLRVSKDNNRIKESIAVAGLWAEVDLKKAIIASRYLNSVGKGENALELSYALIDNLEKKGNPEYKEFTVPGYIKQAIDWICQ
ncbi:MAG TPA: AAA family ATPase [Prolixibacteraceae bacterium]|nr:AAA family ATPase [Prolixibacteraceae bacterium]